MNIKKQLIRHVQAHNAPLRDYLDDKTCIQLLRNAHPLYRSDYARQLKRAGKITEEELLEFV